jgi:hypothetical protein
MRTIFINHLYRMSALKYVNIPVFIISLAIGLFFVYITTGSDMRKIYVYPTPENVDLLQYRDKTNNCFRFKQTEVTCPTNESEITKMPVQG